MYNFLQEQGQIYRSKSFKRLGEKNQIVANIDDKNVHISNRLTHSLEVGIVAKSIAGKLPKDLQLNLEQIFNICLLHDIGHPALGHFLEEKLHHLLQGTGYYFEGNANNFVIIEKEGIKLSDKTLVSLVKYPYELDDNRSKGIYAYQFQEIISNLLKEYVKQQKMLMFNGYSGGNQDFIRDISDDLLKKSVIKNSDIEALLLKHKGKDFRTLESHIMESADDIAYLTHDLADFLIHLSQKEKKKVFLTDVVNLKEYSAHNSFMKYLHVISSENENSVINNIRKKFVNNITFNFESGSLEYIDKELEEFKAILRRILMQEFILPECDILENKFMEESLKDKYFSDINNNEFIDKIVVSGTYKELIKGTDDINKKYRYMANYLAEKTDKWLF